MYPPVGIGQVRVSASHDITLADRLHLPAGTCIWVPHHAIQNVSFNWDDHDKFKPGVPPPVALPSAYSVKPRMDDNTALWVSCHASCSRVLLLTARQSLAKLQLMTV